MRQLPGPASAGTGRYTRGNIACSFLTEWDNPVAYPGCIPVAALERFLLVLVIFDNAERHSRGGLDIRTAEMRERKW